ncbi:MAG: hypothetical protein ACO27F_09685, partial [Beijerinckiaceae bacterium]
APATKHQQAPEFSGAFSLIGVRMRSLCSVASFRAGALRLRPATMTADGARDLKIVRRSMGKHVYVVHPA